MSMLRKYYIVLETANDAEYQQAQEVCNEISNLRVINAFQVLQMGEYIRTKQGTLQKLFNLVKNKGVKGLISFEGVSILNSLR